MYKISVNGKEVEANMEWINYHDAVYLAFGYLPKPLMTISAYKKGVVSRTIIPWEPPVKAVDGLILNVALTGNA